MFGSIKRKISAILPRVASGGRSAFWPVVAIIAVTTAVSPFLRPQTIDLGHLALFQDDFFYYLAIARNMANGGASTFDFIGPTNGYHPLWMLVLTALATLADAHSVTFVVLLQAVVFVLILATAYLFRAVAQSAFADAPAARDAGGLLFVFLYANLTRTGMEVIIALPAMLGTILTFLALARAPSLPRLLGAGLISSVTILARLDASIFVAALMVTIFLFEERPRIRALVSFLSTPRALAVGTLGALPLAGYLALNLMIFGMLLPQSSAAKHITTSFSFNPRVIELFFTVRDNLREQVFFFLMGTLPLLLGLVGSVLLFSDPVRRSRRARIVVVSTNAFALLYYGILSFVSDWTLWIWYLYAIILAGGFGAVCLLSVIQRLPAGLGRWSARLGAPVLGLGVVLLTVGSAVTINPAGNPIHWSALRIAEFARTHPGIYGMGDRGGLAGFLLPRGLVQLEGLVSDPSLLDLIRAQAPLQAAFERFRITYYIGTRMEKRGDCYLAEEPSVKLAGKGSKHMTAALCMPPTAAFTDRQGVTTLIFQVGPVP